MKLFLLGLALFVASLVQASELDETTANAAPKAIVVQVNTKSGQATVYSATDLDRSIRGDKAATEAALARIARPENKVTNLQVQARPSAKASELDTDSSTPAWYYWYWGTYWNAPYVYYPSTYFTYASYPYYWNYSYTWDAWGAYRWYFYWRY